MVQCSLCDSSKPVSYFSQEIPRSNPNALFYYIAYLFTLIPQPTPLPILSIRPGMERKQACSLSELVKIQILLTLHSSRSLLFHEVCF
jgi:hypothetical protein